MASGLFRFIAAVGRTMGVASTFGACALLLQFALGGFALARSKFCDLGVYGSSCLVQMLTFSFLRMA